LLPSFAEDKLWGFKTTTVRKHTYVRLLPCLKDFGFCLLKVLEKFLFQVENTAKKIMEESLEVQGFIY